MSNFSSSPSVILKGVRLDYFDVHEKGAPAAEKDKADPKKWKYKVKAIIDPSSEAAALAKKSFLEAANGLWGANAGNVIKAMAKNSKAIRQGNEILASDGSIRAEYLDMLIISASNSVKPLCIAQKKHNGKFIDVSADGRAFQDGMELNPPPYKITAPYRGCVVNIKVQFIAGKAKGEMPNQVYAKFEVLQFVRDGEAFGAGPVSAEGFDDEEVETSGAATGGSDLFDE